MFIILATGLLDLRDDCSIVLTEVQLTVDVHDASAALRVPKDVDVVCCRHEARGRSRSRRTCNDVLEDVFKSFWPFQSLCVHSI